MAFGGRKIDSSIDAPRHDIVLASRRAINLRVAWIGGSATSTQAASVHFIWSHLHRTRPRSVAYKLPRVRDNRNAKRKKTINCNDTNASVVCPPYRSLSLSPPLLCTLTLHDYDLIATLHTEQESIACTTDRSCAGELTRDCPLMFSTARVFERSSVRSFAKGLCKSWLLLRRRLFVSSNRSEISYFWNQPGRFLQS